MGSDHPVHLSCTNPAVPLLRALTFASVVLRISAKGNILIVMFEQGSAGTQTHIALLHTLLSCVFASELDLRYLHLRQSTATKWTSQTLRPLRLQESW